MYLGTLHTIMWLLLSHW